MKTAVRDTSIEAYRDHKSTGGVSSQHETILAAIGNNAHTRREISHITGIETSSVSGRVNELISMGQLEECGKRRCRITDRTVIEVRKPRGQIGLVL